MIARLWRGWTSLEKADAYEKLLREQVLPGLRQIDGYRGGYILRQEGTDEVEFVVMNLFDSLEAVRAFAGSDYTVPVFEPEARRQGALPCACGTSGPQCSKREASV